MSASISQRHDAASEPNPTPDTPDYDRVDSLIDFCRQVNVSPPTMRRLIRKGEGPTITKLSDRRIGVRRRHGREWLDARAKQKPGTPNRDQPR